MSAPDERGTAAEKGSPPETAAQIEEDIQAIRDHLGEVAGELDRRRHRAADLPRQLRRHAKPLAIGALALAVGGLGVWWWRASSRHTLTGRFRAQLSSLNLGQRLDEVRERVAAAIHPAPPQHPGRAFLRKISSAALVAAAGVVGRHLATQIVGGRKVSPTGPEEPARES